MMGRHSAPEPEGQAVATQVQHPARTVVRTLVQLVIGIAAAMPLIVAESGLPTTTAGVGVALTVSAVVTRLMAVPGIDAVLRQWFPLLAAEPRAPRE